MDLPAHSQADDEGSDPGPPTTRWGTVIGFVALGLLVALMVILHLTGIVGPMAH